MAAVCSVSFNLAGVDQPENISGIAVSHDFLSMMGIRPLLGRDFDTSQERAGTAPVVLLSYQLWQSHFGAEENALGRSITLDDRSFTIIGVLPPDFRLIDKTDVVDSNRPSPEVMTTELTWRRGFGFQMERISQSSNAVVVKAGHRNIEPDLQPESWAGRLSLPDHLFHDA
jgi:hypothetical protein